MNKQSSRSRVPASDIALLAVLLLGGITRCAAGPKSNPGVYDIRKESFKLLHRAIEVTLVKPVKPRSPALLVLFATGDAGWMGASGDVFEHMADEGYYLAGINSRDAMKQTKASGRGIDPADAAAEIDALIVEAKRALELPESVRTIASGDSRGATFVVFAGGNPTLQHHIAGAVAIALTREADFIRTPPPDKLSSTLQVDEKGKIQTYPAIARLGSIPIAVIQSKGDKYVPSDEARRLFGPDTPTRRLYEVDARNHGFSGGGEELLRDLDEALHWIEGIEQGGGNAAK